MTDMGHGHTQQVAIMTTVGELDEALDKFYSSRTSRDDKRIIEAKLSLIRESDDAIQFGCTVLNTTNSQYSLWFACSMLETAISTQWNKCSIKNEVYSFLFRYV